MKNTLSFLLLLSPLLQAQPIQIRIDTNEAMAEASRAGTCSASTSRYTISPQTTESRGRVPQTPEYRSRPHARGSVSDTYFWNGNGILENGKANPERYFDHSGHADYSDYQPGFAVDNNDWSKATSDFIRFDAKSMHELTRKHPTARNMVTVNAGTGIMKTISNPC